MPSILKGTATLNRDCLPSAGVGPEAGAGIAHAVPACRVGWLADEMNVKDDAARDARATESLPRRAD